MLSKPDNSFMITGIRVLRAMRRCAASLVWSLLVATAAASMVGFLVLHLGVHPVLTGSMRGTFDPGSAVLTRSVPVTSLHVGEVVEFVPPGQDAPYTHRVMSITGDPRHPVITTKGDANPLPDSWHARLTGSHVRVVVGSLPGLGRALVWGGQTLARTVFVGLLGLLATGYGVAAILRRPPTVQSA